MDTDLQENKVFYFWIIFIKLPRYFAGLNILVESFYWEMKFLLYTIYNSLFK